MVALKMASPAGLLTSSAGRMRFPWILTIIMRAVTQREFALLSHTHPLGLHILTIPTQPRCPNLLPFQWPTNPTNLPISIRTRLRRQLHLHRLPRPRTLHPELPFPNNRRNHRIRVSRSSHRLLGQWMSVEWTKRRPVHGTHHSFYVC
jgi:hypothetical protein